jgi:hypothetical protein
MITCFLFSLPSPPAVRDDEGGFIQVIGEYKIGSLAPAINSDN